MTKKQTAKQVQTQTASSSQSKNKAADTSKRHVKTAKNITSSGGGNKNNTKKNSENASSKNSSGATNALSEKLKKIAKIDHLPKNVRETIPFRGFLNDGIIETKPGVFTRSYRLNDVNFSIAPDEEQAIIFQNFMDLLNSFDNTIKWQFTIFNHEVDKKETINNIRIMPNNDGLNPYRQELNEILLQNLKSGNNAIEQSKYLTVSIEDNDVEHAVSVLQKKDFEISRNIEPIAKQETKALTAQERIKLLYTIYNQSFDYRLDTGIYNGKGQFDLKIIEKAGLSVKDVIAPPSFDFSKSNRFMMGDTYGQAYYLERVPSMLSTEFLTELSAIPTNMLISTNSEAIDANKAHSLVRKHLTAIDAKISQFEQKTLDDGGLPSTLPPDLAKGRESAHELMEDITSRNQNLFFITFTLVIFSKSEKELEDTGKLVKDVAGKYLCPLKVLRFQQEFGLNTCLPLCRNDIFAERLYTTESAAVFIPYNSQEINQKNAVFYGLNTTTNNMVLYNRLTGANYNGLIFGASGSGKSFTAKFEMLSVLLGKPDAQVFVIDPQGEYYPLTQAINGTEIRLTPGNGVYINPLDLDISKAEGDDTEEDADPITAKVDFVISMFEVILGRGRMLDPIHKSLLDKCTRRIYRAYIEELTLNNKTFDGTKTPTLSDLYQELKLQSKERYEAGALADMLYQYAIGSFDTFAHRTNVKINSRFVVYNTKMLGSGMKELGLHICLNDIWNRMITNSKRNIYTWFYIDEFHLLLETEGTTRFLKRVWKMARKWNGVPTGIMQNTEDLLRDADTRAIVNNTSFVIMLNEPLIDRQNLGALFNLSAAQLDRITSVSPGQGLLYNGKITLPITLKLHKNKNTKLYKIMTTAHDVEGAAFG